MGSGDGIAGQSEVIYLRIPAELKTIVKTYQGHRRFPTFTQAIIELLETHPYVDTVVKSLYSQRQEETVSPGS